MKLIDYEFSAPLTAEALDKFAGYRKLSKDLDFTRDYTAVAETTITLLGRNEKERQNLRGYFERKFLEKVRKKL